MAKDPYQYFRVEARELLEGLSQGLLELEKSGPTKELVSRLLRLAHTLKGAARVVKQSQIAQLAHTIEEVCTPFRDSDVPVPRDRICELFRLFDGISAHLKSLEPTPEPQRESIARAFVDEPFRTVRVDIEKVDELLDGIGETAVSLDSLRRGIAPVAQAVGLVRALGEVLAARRNGAQIGTSSASARAGLLLERLRTSIDELRRALSVGIERTDRELSQAQEAARQLRLVPASAVFASLERTARDAAEALQKQIRFEATGGEHHLDAHVLGALRDALLHLVRNAVAHGIEKDADRIASVKPPVGLVQLHVERRAHRVAFILSDDGRGIDLEAIRQAAIRRHLVDPKEASALGLEEAIHLIFQGGVTTTRTVTEISGRGIGLEVVREIATRLKGELSARTEVGLGTTVEICVPVSLASIAALVVDVGGTVASLPLDSIRGALRVTPDEIAHSPEGNSILHGDRAIPFFPLSTALQKPAQGTRRPSSWSAVVIEAGASRVAVGVDRVLGTSSVVMKPLPQAIDTIPSIAGASFDAEGNPQLVLDTAGLLTTLRTKGGALPTLTPPPRPRVLVIDDSLTTRMLEQSILESAGYDVDVAVSGEEALKKAKGCRYALFIVDIEMPGMDGFEFIERAKRDPSLHKIPSILVTSRSSNEDRRRGEEVGARVYIVKSDFDEAGLLQRIHDLVGG